MIGNSSGGVSAVVVTVVFLCLSICVVLGRLYTRIFILRNTGIDDWLILSAVLASGGFSSAIILQAQHGLGEPFLSLSPYEQLKFWQTLWVAITVYNLSLILTKVSIMFQYRRVFATPKTQRICTYIIYGLVFYGVCTIACTIFQCFPIQYFWDRSGEGSCMDQVAFTFASSALNIATDILVFSFPIPLVRRLQLPHNQKLGLIFIFALGGFVCIASIVRLTTLYKFVSLADVSLHGVVAHIWSTVELNLAITCASIPSMKSIISLIFPRIFNSTRAHGSQKAKYVLQDGITMTDTLSPKSQNRPSEITVVQNVVQDREEQMSRNGSERSLVWKCDCYSEAQHQKSHV